LSPAEQARHDRLTGIALMCGAVVLFACSDAIAKYLNNHMPTVQVVWARYMAAFVLALFMSNPIMRPSIMRTSRPWLQLGRSTLLLVSTALNFFALRYLQLDQAIAIIFCTPFIVAALGGPILGEWIKWRRWTAITVGFCGVLLVTRPGAGGIHPRRCSRSAERSAMRSTRSRRAFFHARTATRPPTSIPTWWARSWSALRCRSSGRRKAIRKSSS
jgi:drug/metabolite transporter (DMT)-like permease